MIDFSIICRVYYLLPYFGKVHIPNRILLPNPITALRLLNRKQFLASEFNLLAYCDESSCKHSTLLIITIKAAWTIYGKINRNPTIFYLSVIACGIYSFYSICMQILTKQYRNIALFYFILSCEVRMNSYFHFNKSLLLCMSVLIFQARLRYVYK